MFILPSCTKFTSCYFLLANSVFNIFRFKIANMSENGELPTRCFSFSVHEPIEHHTKFNLSLLYVYKFSGFSQITDMEMNFRIRYVYIIYVFTCSYFLFHYLPNVNIIICGIILELNRPGICVPSLEQKQSGKWHLCMSHETAALGSLSISHQPLYKIIKII